MAGNRRIANRRRRGRTKNGQPAEDSELGTDNNQPVSNGSQTTNEHQSVTTHRPKNSQSSNSTGQPTTATSPEEKSLEEIESDRCEQLTKTCKALDESLWEGAYPEVGLRCAQILRDETIPGYFRVWLLTMLARTCEIAEQADRCYHLANVALAKCEREALNSEDHEYVLRLRQMAQYIRGIKEDDKQERGKNDGKVSGTESARGRLEQDQDPLVEFSDEDDEYNRYAPIVDMTNRSRSETRVPRSGETHNDMFNVRNTSRAKTSHQVAEETLEDPTPETPMIDFFTGKIKPVHEAPDSRIMEWVDVVGSHLRDSPYDKDFCFGGDT